MRSPRASKVNLTAILALVLHTVPLVKVARLTQRTQLDRGLGYKVARGKIFVVNDHFKVVAHIFHVNIKRLVPAGRLARILHGACSELLHAGSQNHIGVHFGPEIGVSGEASLDDFETERARSACLLLLHHFVYLSICKDTFIYLFMTIHQKSNHFVHFF